MSPTRARRAFRADRSRSTRCRSCDGRFAAGRVLSVLTVLPAAGGGLRDEPGSRGEPNRATPEESNSMALTREIYWNITSGTLIYLFALVAVGFLIYGVHRRLRLWRLGGAEARFDRLPERLSGLLIEIFGHRRQLRDPYSGIAHLFIFYGFLAQLVATSLISLQEWTGIHILQGSFYLWYSLFSDCFGMLGIVGLCMVVWRRGVQRPARLHSVMDDWVALALLLLVFLQGFFVEGVRIAVSELEQQPELAIWSPGGSLVALALRATDTETLLSLHRFSWWFHAVTAFGCIGYLIYGKFSHIFFGLANVFLRDLNPSGKLRHPDIEELAETDPDAIETLGIQKIEQYSWKSLLDLDACVNCGRCEEVLEVTWDFINNNRGHLEHEGEIEPHKVYPSRRSWHHFDKCLQTSKEAGDDLLEASNEGKLPMDLYFVGEGFIGQEASIAFTDFVEKYEKQVSVDDVLQGRKAALIKAFQVNDSNACSSPNQSPLLNWESPQLLTSSFSLIKIQTTCNML